MFRSISSSLFGFLPSLLSLLVVNNCADEAYVGEGGPIVQAQPQQPVAPEAHAKLRAIEHGNSRGQQTGQRSESQPHQPWIVRLAQALTAGMAATDGVYQQQ